MSDETKQNFVVYKNGTHEFMHGLPVDNGDILAVFPCSASLKPLPSNYFDEENNMYYEQMSDFEINSLVAKKYLGLFVDIAKSKGKLDSDAWLIDSEGLLRWTNYNPCHDPKHAWPIIIDNGISLVWMDAKIEYYEAHGINVSKSDEDWHSQHPNGLRAAMICFLKIKDAEK